MGINLGAFLGQLICPIVGDVKDNVGFGTHSRFQMGIFGSFNGNVDRNYYFLYLKNKYVVTPEGRPIGGLPSKHDTSRF